MNEVTKNDLAAWLHWLRVTIELNAKTDLDELRTLTQDDQAFEDQTGFPPAVFAANIVDEMAEITACAAECQRHQCGEELAVILERIKMKYQKAGRGAEFLLKRENYLPAIAAAITVAKECHDTLHERFGDAIARLRLSNSKNDQGEKGSGSKSKAAKTKNKGGRPREWQDLFDKVICNPSNREKTNQEIADDYNSRYASQIKQGKRNAANARTVGRVRKEYGGNPELNVTPTA